MKLSHDHKLAYCKTMVEVSSLRYNKLSYKPTPENEEDTYGLFWMFCFLYPFGTIWMHFTFATCCEVGRGCLLRGSDGEELCNKEVLLVAWPKEMMVSKRECTPEWPIASSGGPLNRFSMVRSLKMSCIHLGVRNKYGTIDHFNFGEHCVSIAQVKSNKNTHTWSGHQGPSSFASVIWVEKHLHVQCKQKHTVLR